MSDIADRLKAAQGVLRMARHASELSQSGFEVMGEDAAAALADFPDPDAVGALLQHAWNTRQHAHNDDLDAALAKLEEK